MNVISIFYCHSPTFYFCHFFKGYLSVLAHLASELHSSDFGSTHYNLFKGMAKQVFSDQIPLCKVVYAPFLQVHSKVASEKPP
jgi:hypothetical protein